MDNPLTPNKIQRLIHLAEDKSFSVPISRRLPLLIHEDDDTPVLDSLQHGAGVNRSGNYESSSGILDLERVQGLGESGIGSISMNKSTAFNPGEMTGRSTGTEDLNSNPQKQYDFGHQGRHSFNMDSLTSELNKQTSDVNNIMRHSIASNFSFHSKRDLTADEVSLVKREGPLPFLQTNPAIIQDSMSMNNTNLSVGAYFKNRCPEFAQVLSKTDSPDRSMRPSITEVSATALHLEQSYRESKQKYNTDQTLDCVPVRQPRSVDKAMENKKTVNPDNIFVKPNNYPPQARLSEKVHNSSVSNVLQKSKLPVVQNFNTTHFAPKHVASSSKPTDVLLKNLQSSFKIMTDDTSESECQSFSISKIADYLGKESNVNVSDMIKFSNQNPHFKKQPLTELQLKNLKEKNNNAEGLVTYLKDTKNMETSSTGGTIDTVISNEKLKLNQENKDVPTLIVTRHSVLKEDRHTESVAKRRTSRSKSPSSRSRSTLSTVQENLASSRSGDSPLHSSKGEGNGSHVLSPNVEYKELDKSVDWQDVLQQRCKKQEGFAKGLWDTLYYLAKYDQWVQIVTSPASGFVGVSIPVVILVTTLTDSWLTAKFHFNDLPDGGRDLAIDMPRQPILLSPGKQEKFTLHITSNIEIKTSLPFTIFLKDASIDEDVEQYGDIDIDFKLPSIQAVSGDGLNKVSFQPIQEQTSTAKSFVLLSDCPVDLQLHLSVSECKNMFLIKNVQEIKKSDVNKFLLMRDNSEEDQQVGKSKSKGLNRQLCRLSSGNAIRVTVIFTAPKLAELHTNESMLTHNASINVNLLGGNTVLKRVDLSGGVGTAKLNVPTNKIQVSREPLVLSLSNTGTITGIWAVKFRNAFEDGNFPFQVTPTKFEIRPNTAKEITVSYVGPQDVTSEGTIVFEDIATSNKTLLGVVNVTEKLKVFPIKTNYNKMSFVRSGRKELSLKNSSERKLQIKCQIVGEGFSIDLPGADCRGIYLTFEALECRTLPIIFTPNTNAPLMATLHLVLDKHSETSRKIYLHGSQSGDPVRWSGLVTYGDTALVRAVSRTPIELKLFNKSQTPVFVYTKVNFNLQYLCAAESAQLAGGRRVVAGRGQLRLELRVEWARVERQARAGGGAALAALAVRAGPELLRARILRILRDKSTGMIDTSLLPDDLKMLAGPFEGEDPNIEYSLKDFNETKESLPELISGLQELTAQIDLPQDFAEENTIIISDDTVIEHHTLCD